MHGNKSGYAPLEPHEAWEYRQYHEAYRMWGLSLHSEDAKGLPLLRELMPKDTLKIVYELVHGKAQEDPEGEYSCAELLVQEQTDELREMTFAARLAEDKAFQLVKQLKEKDKKEEPKAGTVPHSAENARREIDVILKQAGEKRESWRSAISELVIALAHAQADADETPKSVRREVLTHLIAQLERYGFPLGELKRAATMDTDSDNAQLLRTIEDKTEVGGSMKPLLKTLLEWPLVGQRKVAHTAGHSALVVSSSAGRKRTQTGNGPGRFVRHAGARCKCGFDQNHQGACFAGKCDSCGEAGHQARVCPKHQQGPRSQGHGRGRGHGRGWRGGRSSGFRGGGGTPYRQAQRAVAGVPAPSAAVAAARPPRGGAAAPST